MKNNPRKVRFLSFVIMCIGFVLGFIGVFVESKPLLVACVVIVLLGVFYNLIFYMCPYCKKHLGRNPVKCCPHCGKEI